MPCAVLTGAVPASLDFMCLREVFDLRAERRLVSRLASNLGPVSYDLGTFGLQPGLHLKLLGSGLLLASRYPLLRAASQSFLTHVARMLQGTTLRTEDGLLRRKQLTLLLDWAELSEVESRPSDEAVAFSVLLGALNFDDCSLRALEQEEGRRRSLAGQRRPAPARVERQPGTQDVSLASRHWNRTT
ncbi:sphingomyelin phosphodiesterase 5-like [Kogia breviceps]|uniref:sphingomyelin phosphodiesterase 5-like n=1 Tax=Kogia breviceps TaxID=27615 RepID=UPI0034D33954